MVTTATKARPYLENIHYQVVHSCPGRLRIRIPQLVEDFEYVSRLKGSPELSPATFLSKLKSLVESLDAVTSVRLNPTASSMVVEYKHHKAVTSAIVQKQVFTAIEQAASADIPPQALRDLPTPLNIDVSNSSATSLATDDSAILTAEAKSLRTPLHRKTPQEYSLLVRGNYSVCDRLKSG